MSTEFKMLSDMLSKEEYIHDDTKDGFIELEKELSLSKPIVPILNSTRYIISGHGNHIPQFFIIPNNITIIFKTSFSLTRFTDATNNHFLNFFDKRHENDRFITYNSGNFCPDLLLDFNLKWDINHKKKIVSSRFIWSGLIDIDFLIDNINKIIKKEPDDLNNYEKFNYECKNSIRKRIYDNNYNDYEVLDDIGNCRTFFNLYDMRNSNISNKYLLSDIIFNLFDNTYIMKQPLTIYIDTCRICLIKNLKSHIINCKQKSEFNSIPNIFNNTFLNNYSIFKKTDILSRQGSYSNIILKNSDETLEFNIYNIRQIFKLIKEEKQREESLKLIDKKLYSFDDYCNILIILNKNNYLYYDMNEYKKQKEILKSKLKK